MLFVFFSEINIFAEQKMINKGKFFFPTENCRYLSAETAFSRQETQGTDILPSTKVQGNLFCRIGTPPARDTGNGYPPISQTAGILFRDFINIRI